jgi:hypothetical protein
MLFDKLQNSGNLWTSSQHKSRWRTLLLPVLGSIGLALSMPLAGAENFGNQVADAFKEGSFDVAFRYRYEFVDEDSTGPADPVTKNANASTLRTRLVYKTAPLFDTFLTVNMDDVRPFVSSDFNDTRNGKSQYPVVGDPKGTDLNLASLTYTGLEDGKIVLGRQRIIRENSRFVGNVGWRQNEQTYDSVSIDYAFTEKFQAFYGYVDRVKRIFGPEDGTPAASLRSKSHLLDASYTFSPLFRLTGYAYLLDFDNSAGFSSQTLGLRLTGKQALGDGLNFNYTAELASQQDYKDNPDNYDEGYYHVAGGLDWAEFGFKLGYEVLEGSGVDDGSFQTPLATLHKFNGWADQFLVTPDGGLEDVYIQGTAKALGGKFSLIYHDFSAQTGGNDYGSELDFVASWSFMNNYSVLAKFALFEVDSNSPISAHSDISKFWLMLSADF